jgi:hypothetical protein
MTGGGVALGGGVSCFSSRLNEEEEEDEDEAELEKPAEGADIETAGTGG